MSDQFDSPKREQTYAPPSVTRVYLDPIKELLLATCLLGPNDPGVCQESPSGCTPPGQSGAGP
ncbi:MAG: hypothetical protein NVS1B4_08100 [Gemmatimonadaceae bacterium]